MSTYPLYTTPVSTETWDVPHASELTARKVEVGAAIRSGAES